MHLGLGVFLSSSSLRGEKCRGEGAKIVIVSYVVLERAHMVFRILPELVEDFGRVVAGSESPRRGQ